MVSTSAGERQCPICDKAISTARVRAAMEPINTESRKEAKALFDLDYLRKSMWAKYYDMRKRAMRWDDFDTIKYAEERMKFWDAAKDQDRSNELGEYADSTSSQHA